MKPALETVDWREFSEISENMLNAAYRGFLKHRRSHLEEVGRLKNEWAAVVPVLAEHLLTQLSVGTMVEIMNHLEFIRNGIEQVVEQTEVKINDGVLFSDKAVNELKKVFDGTGELLNHLRDYWMTGSPVVARHMLGQITTLSEKCAEFSTEHEERLIKGICLPRSSTIYLNILAALRDMLKHIGQLVQTMGQSNYRPAKAKL